jgi:hypothetical protein
MATKIVYEPQYVDTGWFDDSGMSMDSWFDRDLAGTVLLLVRAEPPFFYNTSVIYQPPPITMEALAGFFLNESTFFQPMSVRIISKPDQMIRNEVRRLR